MSIPNQRSDLPTRQQGNRDWFAERREHFERQVVEEFFRLIRVFLDIYGTCMLGEAGKAEPQCRFADPDCGDMQDSLWNQLAAMVGTAQSPGPFWQLKDLCHRVWPEPQQEEGVLGAMLDWTIGSAFHEMMKLKENIHLLNSYGPAGMALDRSAREQISARDSAALLAGMPDIDELLHRLVGDVSDAMELIGKLLGQANYILRAMMRELAVNPLVVRLLAEQEETVSELWGETLPHIFSEMFDQRPAEGFCVAGRSYLLGQWYLQALTMFERALALDPGCDEAVAKVAQLRAIVAGNRSLMETAPHQCPSGIDWSKGSGRG